VSTASVPTTRRCGRPAGPALSRGLHSRRGSRALGRAARQRTIRDESRMQGFGRRTPGGRQAGLRSVNLRGRPGHARHRTRRRPLQRRNPQSCSSESCSPWLLRPRSVAPPSVATRRPARPARQAPGQPRRPARHARQAPRRPRRPARQAQRLPPRMCRRARRVPRNPSLVSAPDLRIRGVCVRPPAMSSDGPVQCACNRWCR
jgi:hypothetical protein